MAKEPSFPQLTYFRAREFDCQCGRCVGGAEHMDVNLLVLLDHARAEAGVPFVITSAYRCAAHNRSVGGVTNSAHTRGQAVDIATLSSRARFEVLRALLAMGAQRVGIGSTFVHVDTDETKPRRVAWDY